MKWAIFALVVFLGGLGVIISQENGNDEDICEDTELIELPMPGSEDQTLKIVLFGDAELDITEGDGTALRLPARNKAGFNVNLRGGPGTNYDQVGVFGYGRETEADGRNEGGDWLRILTDNGTAWIAARFIAADGDINSLPVVEGNEPASSGPSYVLLAGDCDESGLLLDYEGEESISIHLNGMVLNLMESLLHIQYVDENQLQLTVLAGEVETIVGEESILMESSTTHNVLLDEEHLAESTAESSELVLFAAVDPLISRQLVDETRIPCLAGVSSEDEVTVYLVASIEAEIAFILSSDSYYRISEQQTVDEVDWWQISDGELSGWVEQSVVQVLGNCEDVATTQAATTSNDQGNNTPNTSNNNNSSPTQDPASVMYAYLQARLNTDAAQMQALSCSAWDSQAIIQAQSFRSMQAELRDVACTTTSQDGSTASVFCSGNIATFYNDQERLWPLGSYSMVIEGGQWRMCGEG